MEQYLHWSQASIKLFEDRVFCYNRGMYVSRHALPQSNGSAIRILVALNSISSLNEPAIKRISGKCCSDRIKPFKKQQKLVDEEK